MTAKRTASRPGDTEATPSPSQEHKSPTDPVVSGTSVEERIRMQLQIQAHLQPKTSFSSRMGRGLGQIARNTTQTYITYGQTEVLFKSCAAQADYTIPEEQRAQVLTGRTPPQAADGADLGQPMAPTWWFTALDLPPTFSTWSQVTFLHLYLLTVGLRALDKPADFQSYQRYLIEHYSQAAEEKMVVLHNVSARSIRNKYLKDLFLQWRGVIAAYDEGLVKGDAVLGSAIWRNLFRAQEDVDWTKVARVVEYMRRVVVRLGSLEPAQLMDHVHGSRGLWATLSA